MTREGRPRTPPWLALLAVVLVWTSADGDRHVPARARPVVRSAAAQPGPPARPALPPVPLLCVR